MKSTFSFFIVVLAVLGQGHLFAQGVANSHPIYFEEAIPKFITSRCETEGLDISEAYSIDDHSMSVHAKDDSEAQLLTITFRFAESAQAAKALKDAWIQGMTQMEPSLIHPVRDHSLPGDEANIEVTSGKLTYLIFQLGTVVIDVHGRTDEKERWLAYAWEADKFVRLRGEKTALCELLKMFPEKTEEVGTEAAPPEFQDRKAELSQLSLEAKSERFAELVDSLARFPRPDEPLAAAKGDSRKSEVERKQMIDQRKAIVWELAQLKLPETQNVLAALASDTEEEPRLRAVCIQALGAISPSGGVELARQLLDEIPPQRATDDRNISGLASLRNECVCVLFDFGENGKALKFFSGIEASLGLEAQMTREEFGERIALLKK